MNPTELVAFTREIPSVWWKVFAGLEKQGYTCILTGGTVRDYFLLGRISSDWDLEIRHPFHSFNKDDWKNLGKEFSQLGKVTFLPYEIIRLEVDKFQFEFSPPRMEKFEDGWKNKGHSNFEAQFNFQLPFDKTVHRRDFTINSIGICFHGVDKVEVLDPLNGFLHLRSRELHSCGPDFEKDPVRFLRAIRFSLKLDFKFSRDLMKTLELMPIQGANHNYLWSELQKSAHPIEMYALLLDWAQKKAELELPVFGERILQKWDVMKNYILEPSKHESWLIGFEWVGISGVDWQNFFKLPSDWTQRISRWVKGCKIFISMKPETFHGDFTDIVIKTEFEILFDWFYTTKQIIQKDTTSTVLRVIELHLPDWIHLYQFEMIKDVKHVDPPLRAKYQLWNLCQRL